jgi:hypothetical protein
VPGRCDPPARCGRARNLAGSIKSLGDLSTTFKSDCAVKIDRDVPAWLEVSSGAKKVPNLTTTSKHNLRKFCGLGNAPHDSNELRLQIYDMNFVIHRVIHRPESAAPHQWRRVSNREAIAAFIASGRWDESSSGPCK